MNSLPPHLMTGPGVRRTQDGRRMVRGQDFCSAVLGQEFTALPRNSELTAQQSLRGRRSQADDQPRSHNRNLGIQPRTTGADLPGTRLGVKTPLSPRSPLEMLHHVGHVRGVPLDPDGLEPQEPSGGPHERPSLNVFAIAGSLAHQHQGCPGRPLAKHRLSCVAEQVASLALRGASRRVRRLRVWGTNSRAEGACIGVARSTRRCKSDARDRRSTASGAK
jgi:hypothetical protein